MRKTGIVALTCIIALSGLVCLRELSEARIIGTNPTGALSDLWCNGGRIQAVAGAINVIAGTEICQDSSGNWIPTTNGTQNLGTQALQWQNAYVSGAVVPPQPAAQALLATSTVTANACGGVKMISATGPITLGNQTPIGAPGTAPCEMILSNVGTTGAITISYAAGQDNWIGATGITLQPSRSAVLVSTSIVGPVWMDAGATPVN